MTLPDILGTDLFGEPIRMAPKAPLADRFLVPPFSVLDARAGDWQERKRAWLALGIKSEIGRGGCADKLTMSETVKRLKPSADQAAKRNGLNGVQRNAGTLHPGDTGRQWGETYEGGDGWAGEGTSIFDPVLCEALYRWYSPPGGLVIDPFAGGSVRGIVAALMGRKYWGCDLQAKQVAANKVQAATICPDNPPEWVTGDAREVLGFAPEADFVFTCPPYGDLERYSDDPKDLSTMDLHAFLAALREVVRLACGRLRPNRFAAIVVGEYRDGAGNYRNFVGHTVEAFRKAGLHYYNEAVLLTAVGSLPIRVGRQFEAGRKLGKTHQNVLVFLKGDAKAATLAVRGADA